MADGGPSDVVPNNGINEASAASPSSDGDDPSWFGNWEDFGATQIGMISSSDDDGSFMENPQEELGMYDPDKDLSSWTFDQLFADSQWHETDLFLQQDTENFSGPQPGPTLPRASSPLEYFRRFWPDDVLDRITLETNRWASNAFFDLFSFAPYMSGTFHVYYSTIS
jgi:hypothetical protein